MPVRMRLASCALSALRPDSSCSARPTPRMKSLRSTVISPATASAAHCAIVCATDAATPSPASVSRTIARPVSTGTKLSSAASV